MAERSFGLLGAGRGEGATTIPLIELVGSAVQLRQWSTYQFLPVVLFIFVLIFPLSDPFDISPTLTSRHTVNLYNLL